LIKALHRTALALHKEKRNKKQLPQSIFVVVIDFVLSVHYEIKTNVGVRLNGKIRTGGKKKKKKLT
jgi:hypothetical protein